MSFLKSRVISSSYIHTSFIQGRCNTWMIFSSNILMYLSYPLLYVDNVGLHSRLDYGNGVLVGVPANLMRRLQSVLNAAARLIYRLKTRDHITYALISLHWLRVPERIQYKLATLAYRVLHGDAPRYLGPLIRVDDLPGRRPFRSTNTNRLVVPQVKLSTVGSRAFAVAASDIWNRLPTDVVAANLLSVSTFRRLLKRFFISAIIPWCSLLTSPNKWSLQWLCHLSHFKNSFDWLIDWLVSSGDLNPEPWTASGIV